ncbi:MAG: DUF2314 domain-containing protein [Fimbriimonadaceae bacterium]|nr:DUF2314 domain-containing protein [Fimbriimonadaceae bacterium]
MNRLWAIFAVAALLSTVVCGCKWETKTHIDPAEEQAKEAKKLEALAEAKRTLPDFWAKYEAYGGTDATYSVKVRLKDSVGNTEDLWVSSFERIDETRWRGGLADAPKKITGFKQFQIIEFNPADIVDWWIMDSRGSSTGRFTGYD